jgi:hypothetical protein
MAHDVFISHSAKDKATADAVCATLESEGIRCWIAPRDVLPSMGWGEAIIDAIEESRIMVLVFTAHANDSPQIRREIERAVNHGVAILPLRMENVLPGRALEYFISDVHWLDALTPPLEAHLRNLAGTIKVVLARTEPGAPATLPREERPSASGGHRAGGAPLENAGRRERAPAPRPFWSVRAWTWAPGTITVLLLCSMAAWMIGSRFAARSPQPNAPNPASSPAPGTTPVPGVPGPAQPIGNAPGATTNNAASLRDTMSTIQAELNGIGTVSFTRFAQDKTGSSPLQKAFVEQVSNVVADPAQCRVSYHWKMWQNGAVTLDKDAWFLLPSVTSVAVEPESQFLTEGNAASGHPLVVTSTTPPVAALVVRRASIYNGFPFTDATLANRAAQSITQAVKLCGGTLAN